MVIKFRYTAKDKSGRPVAGTVEAEGKEEAVNKIHELRRYGFTDIRIESAGMGEKTERDLSKYKKCPFCAEEIKEEAVVCGFCRMDLKTRKPLQAKAPAGVTKSVKIGFEIFIVLPFALVLVIIGALIFSGEFTPLLKDMISLFHDIMKSLADDWFFSIPALILTSIFLSRYVENKRKYFFVLSLALVVLLGIFCYLWLG